MTTVVVLGAGALGSVYGAWFAEAGAEVTLVARPAHADAVNRGGLRIDDQPPVAVKAVVNPADAGDCDILLLASKAFDNAELLNGYQGSAQAAFSVQNGVRQAEPLVARFGSAAVGCVSLVGGTLGEPGHAHHTFNGPTPLGDLPTTVPGTAAAIARALPGRGVEVHDDIAPALWSKGVLAAAAMGVVGLTRLVYHRIFLLPETRDVFYDLACEGAAIAAAEGVEFIDGHGPFQIRALTQESRAEAHLAAPGRGRAHGSGRGDCGAGVHLAEHRPGAAVRGAGGIRRSGGNRRQPRAGGARAANRHPAADRGNAGRVMSR